jgi:hypothetical protein
MVPRAAPNASCDAASRLGLLLARSCGEAELDDRSNPRLTTPARSRGARESRRDVVKRCQDPHGLFAREAIRARPRALGGGCTSSFGQSRRGIGGEPIPRPAQ